MREEAGRDVGASPRISVVIPAYNAQRTLARVLESLAAQECRPDEILVVDDASTDRTAEVAHEHDARVIRSASNGFAGGARNRGWEASTGDVVVFLDADAIPGQGWGTGLARALEEFPRALVGCARTFDAHTRWGWVAHLQVETPYLPRGEPRDVPFVSSYCLAVPRDAPIRWDESYGGEDAVFCADAIAAGMRLVFDPRFHAAHDHGRETYRELRSQQRRLAYGLARAGPLELEGAYKNVFSRLPAHYFALARLPVIYRRLAEFPDLRRRFLRTLPWLALGEWTLGLSALRYAIRRPPLRSGRRRLTPPPAAGRPTATSAPGAKDDRTGSAADVVVVAFRSGGQLRNCVEPLAGEPDITVIVVDNDCPDESTRTVADLDVAVVEMGYNAGFAAGCNAGAAAGTGDALVFLNPDARMAPNEVRALTRKLEEDPCIAAVGPLILEQDGTTQLSMRYFPRLRSAFGEALFLHHIFRRADWPTEIVRSGYDARASVEWLSGAVLCVRRSAFQAVGGFDERFFMYSEDADLCTRLRERGWLVLYDPRPSAMHKGGGSAPRPLQAALRVRGRILYARLHARGPRYAAFRLAYTLHELLRLLAAAPQSVTHLRGRAAALRASLARTALENRTSVDGRPRPKGETDGSVMAGAEPERG